MPCQQRTKKKGLFLILIATNIWQCVLSLSHPFILKQHCEHELSVSFKKRHGKWARIRPDGHNCKTSVAKHAHPATLKAIQPMQTHKLHFPIRQLGLNFEWHGTQLTQSNTGGQPPLSRLLSLPPEPNRALSQYIMPKNFHVVQECK